MEMTAARAAAIMASAYNLHVGPQRGGAAMTPAAAQRLPRGDKAALCRILETKGGSDIYTADDARSAFAFVSGARP